MIENQSAPVSSISEEKSFDFSLEKVTKKIDILCLGQHTLTFSYFLKQYTEQQSDDNQLQNIYVKKINQKAIFLHQWSYKQDLFVVEQFQAVIFFVDMLNSLNNTIETLLKYLQIISQSNGINLFKIPVILIALNGSKLNQQQFLYEKRRLEKKMKKIIRPKQIIYFSEGNRINTLIVNQKLENFFNGIIDGYSNGIISSHYVLWKLYGLDYIVYKYWTDIKISSMMAIERALQKNKKYLANSQES